MVNVTCTMQVAFIERERGITAAERNRVCGARTCDEAVTYTCAYASLARRRALFVTCVAVCQQTKRYRGALLGPRIIFRVVQQCSILALIFFGDSFTGPRGLHPPYRRPICSHI
jgi:hypothetical protein